MFQFKQDIGCYHGKSKSDCRKWKSASKASSRGWFGGEVNSPQMESQVFKGGMCWAVTADALVPWGWVYSPSRLIALNALLGPKRS